MFDNLIETKPRKQKTFKTMVLSVVIHAVLISGAVYGTLQAKEALEKPKAEKVEFVEMKKDEPPPPKEEAPPPPEIVAAPPPPKGFQVLTAPIKIPDVLPEIDLSKKMTDEADFHQYPSFQYLTGYGRPNAVYVMEVREGRITYQMLFEPPIASASMSEVIALETSMDSRMSTGTASSSIWRTSGSGEGICSPLKVTWVFWADPPRIWM